MTVVPSVESYRRDQDDLDLYFGLQSPTADELHDEQCARQDRLTDYAPSSQAPAQITVPVLSSNGPSPSLAFAPPTRDERRCRRDGEGPNPF